MNLVTAWNQEITFMDVSCEIMDGKPPTDCPDCGFAIETDKVLVHFGMCAKKVPIAFCPACPFKIWIGA